MMWRVATPACVLLFFATAAGAQSSRCVASGDDGMRLLQFARQLATTTDTLDARVRINAGFTAMDSTKVLIETDARTCAASVAGINARLGTPGAPRLVHLIRMTTQGYLALVPALAGTFPGSEYNPIWVLTRQGNVRTGILAY